MASQCAIIEKSGVTLQQRFIWDFAMILPILHLSRNRQPGNRLESIHEMA
jgi:hypothetical protein